MDIKANQIKISPHFKANPQLTNNCEDSTTMPANANIKSVEAGKLALAYQANNLSITNLKSVAFKGSGLDLNNIQMYNLPNNIRFNAYTSNEITQTELSIQLTPNKVIPAKPAASDLLSLMINDSPKIKDLCDKNGITIFTELLGKTIISRVKCNPDKTNLATKILKESLFDPEFNDEKLTKAKQFLKKSYNFALNDPNFQKELTLSGEDINEKIKSIDEITLQDIQSLYSQVICNSSGKTVITLPKQVYNIFKDEIIQSLSIGIPTLMHYQEASDPNMTSSIPLAKTKIFIKANDADNSTKISQSFKIIHNGNMNDIVAIRLLNVILGESNNSTLYKDLKEKKHLADEVYSDCYEYTENKNLSLNATINNNNLLNQSEISQDSIKKCIEEFKNDINDLVNNPVSNEELKKAKLALKNSFLKDLQDSSQKNDLFLYNTPYGINYINSYINAIDKVTPAYIQEAARMYLTKPSVISIITDKKAIENNKEYLESLGEINKLN